MTSGELFLLSSLSVPGFNERLLIKTATARLVFVLWQTLGSGTDQQVWQGQQGLSEVPSVPQKASQPREARLEKEMSRQGTEDVGSW